MKDSKFMDKLCEDYYTIFNKVPPRDVFDLVRELLDYIKECKHSFKENPGGD